MTTLTISGTLLIGGILGVGEGSYQKPTGHTMGSYSQVTLTKYSHIVNKGKIELQGTPREVFSEVEKMKKLGLEVPQVTELGFELQKEGLNIKNGTLEIDELVDEIVRVYNNN